VECWNRRALDSYILKSEDLSLTFSFGLSWIPACPGMTRQPARCHSRENGNPENFKYFWLGFYPSFHFAIIPLTSLRLTFLNLNTLQKPDIREKSILSMKTYIFPWVLIWPDDPLPSCCFFDIVRQNSVGESNDWFKSKPVLKKGWAFLFFNDFRTRTTDTPACPALGRDRGR